MAVKHIYIDPGYVGSSDGTYAKPFKYPPSLVYTSGADETVKTYDECVVHYKRGYVYNAPYATGGSVSFLNLTPAGFVRVEPYGDAALAPTSMTGWHIKPGAEAWAYLGAGVWKLTFAYDWAANGASSLSSWRLFAASGITGAPVGNGAQGTGYRIGYGLARAEASYLASDTDDALAMSLLHTPTGLGWYREWLCTQRTSGANEAYLYVYTGSPSIEPAAYYDGLVLTAYTGYLESSGGHGKWAGLRASNCKNLTISGIDSVFAAQAADIIPGASGASNVVIERCQMLAFGAPARVMGAGASTPAIDCGFRDVLIDGRMLASEEHNWRAKGVPNVATPHDMDGLQIGPDTTRCFAERVAVRDVGHGLFTLGGATNRATIDARITDCTASNANVMWGYGLMLLPMGADNVARVDRLRCSDVMAFIHSTGIGSVVVRDSAFARTRAPYPAYDGGYPLNDDNRSVTTPAINLFCSGAFPTLSANRVIAQRCTFMEPYGYMICCNTNGYNAIPTGAVKFADCVFVDRQNLDDGAARNLNMTRGQTPGLSVQLRLTGPNTGIVDFQRCYYWTGEAGKPRVFVDYNDSTPPYVTKTTFAGTTKISGTITEVDPGVDATGRPLAGSPLRGLAPTAGLTRDAAGVYRDVMSAIGAYEYVNPRPPRSRS